MAIIASEGDTNVHVWILTKLIVTLVVSNETWTKKNIKGISKTKGASCILDKDKS